MKKIISILALFVSGFGLAQEVIIQDLNFKNILLSATSNNNIAKNSNGSFFKIDSNDNNSIELNEALNVFSLDVTSTIFSTDNDVVSLNGIQSFANLKNLECEGNSITLLNLSGMNSLENIDCSHNDITSVNLLGLTNLKIFNGVSNNFTSIDLSGLNSLEDLVMYNNQLTSLDVSGLTNLKYITCFGNQISNLNLGGLTSLLQIAIGGNQLTSIDLTGLSNLNYLDCGSNLLTNINIQSLNVLGVLECYNNFLSAINLNGMSNLYYLSIQNNLLTSLDCSNSGIKNLHCSGNLSLQSINVQNNIVGFSDPDLLGFLFDFGNLPSLTSICLDTNEIPELVYTNYNSSGNVVLYSGANCSLSDNNFENNNFKISPNPFSSTFDINSNQLIKSYQVVDLLGKKIITTNSKQDLNSKTEVLKNGIYLLELTFDNGKTGIVKLIKK